MSLRVVLAFCLAACVAAPRAPAERPRGFRLLEGPHPTAYRVRFDVDPARLRLRGEGEIDVADAGGGAVVLHAHELVAITEARWNHEVLAVVPLANDMVALVGKGVGGEGTLHLRWTAPLSRSRTAGAFAQTVDGRWYAFTQFEPLGARRLMPCFDEPGFKTPWTLELVVPEDNLALSNAPAAGTEKLPAGLRYRFQPTPPLPSYLVAFAVGPFEMLEAGRSRGGAEVRVAVPRGHAGEASIPRDDTAILLARLEDYLGSPYPYAKLDLVPIPSTSGFAAMEHPGLITFRADRFLYASPGVSERKDYALLAAHELAHQWFGNLVTPRWWDDVWLNESFADWLADEIVAAWQPSWGIELDRVVTRHEVVTADARGDGRVIREAVRRPEEAEAAFDRTITYRKGKLGLAMLESWLGRERFRDALRAYLRAHAGGAASHTDLVVALGAGEMIEGLVGQPGTPHVRLALVCPSDRPARVELRQERFALPFLDAGPARRWQVPVELAWWNAGRQGRARTLLTGERGELVLEAAAGCPAHLLGNPDGRGHYVWTGAGPAFAAPPADLWGSLPEVSRLEWIVAARLGERAGVVDVADLVVLAERAAGERDPRLREQAVAVADTLADDSPAYRDWLARHFHPDLDLAPQGGLSRDEWRVRVGELLLLGWQGQDERVLAAARAATRAWLDHGKPIARPLRHLVLGLAAQHGDAALFDQLVAMGDKEPEVLAALGAFRDPTLHQRALELALSDKPAQWTGYVLVLAYYPDVARVRRHLDFLRAHDAELRARVPAWLLALAYRAGQSCTREGLDAVRAHFGTWFPRGSAAGRDFVTFLAEEETCVTRRDPRRAGLARRLAAP